MPSAGGGAVPGDGAGGLWVGLFYLCVPKTVVVVVTQVWAALALGRCRTFTVCQPGLGIVTGVSVRGLEGGREEGKVRGRSEARQRGREAGQGGGRREEGRFEL